MWKSPRCQAVRRRLDLAGDPTGDPSMATRVEMPTADGPPPAQSLGSPSGDRLADEDPPRAVGPGPPRSPTGPRARVRPPVHAVRYVLPAPRAARRNRDSGRKGSAPDSPEAGRRDSTILGVR